MTMLSNICLTTQCFAAVGLTCETCYGKQKDCRTGANPLRQSKTSKNFRQSCKKSIKVAGEESGDVRPSEVLSATAWIEGVGHIGHGRRSECVKRKNVSEAINQPHCDEDVRPSEVLSATAWREGNGDIRSRHKCVKRKNVSEAINQPDCDEYVRPSEVLSATAWREGSNYVCPFCDTKFSSESRANEHMIQQHGVTKVYKCPVEKCPQSSLHTLSGFRVHMIKAHNIFPSKKVISCPVCFKVFSSISNLKIHNYRVHEQTEKITCEVCAVEVRKKNLPRHMNLHQPRSKAFKCGYYGCNKLYAAEPSLKSHVKFHHERDKHYIYPCKNCKKTFGSRSAAQQHYIACAGIRRFPCNICGATYAYESVLKAHTKRKHTNQLHIMSM